MVKYMIAVFAVSTPLLFCAQGQAATGDKPSASECESIWKSALGSNAAGDLDSTKAMPYVSNFKLADQNADGKLTSDEWSVACDKGWVKSAANVGSNAPASEPGGKTSDRTPGGATERSPGAGTTGAAGTDAGQTKSGTSDRTPYN